DPFERRLVELARMAREETGRAVALGRHDRRVAEYDAPRRVRFAPPQLAIDEVGDAPEAQAEGDGGRRDVEERERRLAAPPREDRDGENGADEAAVGRHAALPAAQEVARVLEVVAGLVEQRVAEAAAEHDAADQPDQEIVDVGNREGRFPCPKAAVGYELAG